MRALVLLLTVGMFSVAAMRSADASTLSSVPNIFNKYVVNTGQWPADVVAMKHVPGMNIWVTRTGWVYDHVGTWVDEGYRRGHATVVQFTAGSITAPCAGISVRGVDTVYRAGGGSMVLADSVVRSFGPYDVVDYLYQAEARYDVHCAVGARVSDVALVMAGHTGTSVVDGDLVVHTPLGTITHDELAVIANDAGARIQRTAAFVVDGNVVRVVADNDHGDLPVVVDPIVRSTYAARCCLVVSDVVEIGDDLFAVGTYDGVAGFTFPQTPGLYTSNSRGGSEGFIISFSRDLTTLRKATIVGGAGTDRLFAVTSVADTALVVVGSTTSTDFPTTETATQRTLGGGIDGTVTVLSADLTRLLFSSYHGMTADEVCVSVTSASGSLVVVGSSRNFSFPVVGGQNRGAGGTGDMGIARFTTQPWGLARSFNLGGPGNDQVNGVLALADGTIAFFGQSTSGFPLPTAGHATTKPTASTIDALVFRMDAQLDTILSATWVGGPGVDGFWSGAQQKDGTLIAAGSTTSDTLDVITANALQKRGGGGGDMLLATWNGTLEQIEYCSFFGGSQSDYPHTLGGKAIVVMPSNEVAVLGLTRSLDIPLSSPTTDATLGSQDLYLALFRPSMDSLLYGTLIGGGDQEGTLTNPISGGVVLTRDSLLLVGTQTRSVDFPTTPGAYQERSASAPVGVVFTAAPHALGRVSASATTACAGDPVDVQWEYSGPEASLVTIDLVHAGGTAVLATVGAAQRTARITMPDVPAGLCTLYVTVVGTGGAVRSATITATPGVRITAPDTVRYVQVRERDVVNFEFTVPSTASRVEVREIVFVEGTGSVTTTSPALPAVLDPGTTISVQLAVPKQSGRVAVTAAVGSCALSDTVLIEPERGITIGLRVLDATFSASPSIPDTLRIESNLSFATLNSMGVDSIELEIEYSSLFLTPQDPALRNPSLSGRTFLTLRRALKEELDNVITIVMIPLLGPDSTTVVRITNVRLVSMSAEVVVIDGTIRLTGHCLVGGLRGVVPFVKPDDLIVFPNPTTGHLTATIGGQIQMGDYAIHDNLSRTVHSGSTTGAMDLSHLQPGTYSLVMQGKRALFVVHR